MRDAPTIDRLSPGAFLDIVKRRWYVVLICLVAVPIVAYTLSARKPDRFEASAELLLRPNSVEALIQDQQPVGGTGDPARDALTAADLVGGRSVARRTARELGGGATTDSVAGSVTITPGNAGESNVVEVRATDGTARGAARLANVYADQAIVLRRTEDRQTIDATRRTLERLIRSSRDASQAGSETQRARRRELTERVARLEELSALQTGNAAVVERAPVPVSPVAPNPRRDAILGVGFGLLLGVGLAFLFAAFDRRLRSLESVEDSYQRPILGAIPVSRTLADKRIPGALGPADREAFRMLRANLRYFKGENELRSVLVTSAQLGEGKSTVAWNLAGATAEAGHRVLLIEADLRRPALAERFGVDAEQGLADVLAGRADPREVLIEVALPGRANGRAPHTMEVIFAGTPQSNPMDPLESSTMQRFLEEAERAYDLVIIDTPPLSVVSDAIPLIGSVDGVLLVSRMGTSTRGAAVHVIQQLERLGARVLGVVVNSIGSGDGEYGYTTAAAKDYVASGSPRDD